MARVLIEHGANLDLMDKKDQTALMFVVQYDRIGLYQFKNEAKCKSLTELMKSQKRSQFALHIWRKVYFSYVRSNGSF